MEIFYLKLDIPESITPTNSLIVTPVCHTGVTNINLNLSLLLLIASFSQINHSNFFYQ